MRMLFKLGCLLFILYFSMDVQAQIRIKGSAIDAENSFPLVSAYISIKEAPNVSCITNENGEFVLKTNQPLPFALGCSYIGYEDQEIIVNDEDQKVEFRLNIDAFKLDAIVLTTSSNPKWDNFVNTGVPLQSLRLQQIKNSTTSDFYDEIAKLPGVHSNQGSFTFNTLNTRGFASAGNTRFVQLVDGIDNSAPILNFPLGNLAGMSELDVQSVELIPGTASALYGPNAFNGILQMKSKSPFEFTGLSAQAKYSFMDAENLPNGADPFTSLALRYAQKLNDRFAFKVNFSYLEAQDWVANDYTLDRNTLTRDNVDAPNFDGMHLYGDETQIPIFFNDPSLTNAVVDALTPGFTEAFIAGGVPPGYAELLATQYLSTNVPLLNPIQFTRDGFREEDLLDNRDVGSIKADAALHYRFNDNWEASYTYRFGQGTGVLQGSERFVIKDFTLQNHKLELTSPTLSARAYMTQTDAGDSYNLGALAGFASERFSPTASEWAANYAGAYAGGLLEGFAPVWLMDMTQTVGGAFTDEQRLAAHDFARMLANSPVPDINSDEAQRVFDDVRNKKLNEGGAGFTDDSRVYHAELNYDFSNLIDNLVELKAGGNWRQYDLFTDATVLNEDPEGTGNPERIQIDEYGGYLQASKKVLDDKVKVTGSLRYDKNENFDGQVSPRASVLLSPDNMGNHIFRVAYQEGFQNPSTQDQYLYFPAAAINIGGTRDNAERYGIYEGGAWSSSSFLEYQQCLLAGGDPNVCGQILKTQNLSYVQPEKLKSFEFGYRTRLIDRKLDIDLNAYTTIFMKTLL